MAVAMCTLESIATGNQTRAMVGLKKIMKLPSDIEAEECCPFINVNNSQLQPLLPGNRVYRMMYDPTVLHASKRIQSRESVVDDAFVFISGTTLLQS